MYHDIQADVEEQRNTLLTHAKQSALNVVQQYDLDWERIAFNQHSDTITFKIDEKRMSVICFAFIPIS